MADRKLWFVHFLEELDDKTLETLRLDYEGLASKAKSRAKAPERRPARSKAKGPS